MTGTEFEGLDQLRSAVGTHLGYNGWHTVTQEQIDLFARATGDCQWIHVDPHRAAEGPFKATIAHGYLTLSLLPALVREVYRVSGVGMIVNYGSNSVRFLTPVTVGSQIRAGVELLSLEPHKGSSRLTSKVTVDIAESTKPACIAETVSLYVG